MAGVWVDEAETLAATILFKRTSSVDRDADLTLALITNTATQVGETLTATGVTQPTGTGYAVKTLTDASWSVTTGVASYAKQTFTCTATDWTGAVSGYAILTKAAGGTVRLLCYELDTATTAPYTFSRNDTYDITPSVTVA